jgi:hypothetical protein
MLELKEDLAIARELNPKEENVFEENLKVKTYLFGKSMNEFKKLLVYRPQYEKRGSLYKFSGTYRVYIGYPKEARSILDLRRVDEDLIEETKDYILIPVSTVSKEYKVVLLTDLIKATYGTVDLRDKAFEVLDMGTQARVILKAKFKDQILEIPITPYELIKGSYIVPLSVLPSKEKTDKVLLGIGFWTGYTGNKALTSTLDLYRLVCTNGQIMKEGKLNLKVVHKSLIPKSDIEKFLKSVNKFRLDTNRLLTVVEEKEREKIEEAVKKVVNRKEALSLWEKEVDLIWEVRKGKPYRWDIANSITALAKWKISRDFRVYSNLQKIAAYTLLGKYSKN